MAVSVDKISTNFLGIFYKKIEASLGIFGESFYT